MLNPDTAGPGAALREITRAIRRICLLQEVDRQEEASRLETKILAPLIHAFRTAHGADALPDARIREIVVVEQRRAGDAAALNELLAPLLAEFLAVPAEAGRAGHPSAGEAEPSPARRHPVVAPEIADLLDGMLAQERPRPAARSRHSRT